MNDLAERALHGLDVARRFVVARPVPWLAGAGFLAGTLVMVVGARIGAARAALPLDTWLGLLPPAGYHSGGRLPGVLVPSRMGMFGLPCRMLFSGLPRPLDPGASLG